LRNSIKKPIEINLSFFLLIVAMPLFTIFYPVVRFSSPGPFFFRQNRMGRNGKLFSMYKIRTMVTVSENEGGGLTINNDPRVTSIGRFLRKTKIDELPQLINIIRGHMSFVGPRPELPRYGDVNPELWKKILSIRPGLTDETSLEFYAEEEAGLKDFDTADTVYRMDILPRKQKRYISLMENRNLISDMNTILKTIKFVFSINKKTNNS
ncbi:sugar transferase, partial [candidate division KSB1 bacterium]|nr:sugar transferase [candidate division KSB1 bacterium]